MPLTGTEARRINLAAADRTEVREPIGRVQAEAIDRAQATVPVGAPGRHNSLPAVVEIDRAAAVPQIVPVVAAARNHRRGQVAAARNHRHDQVAVAGTKSVTARHRLRVMAIAAEDLAAAAATTPARAAAGAAEAWAAADSVEVVVAAAVEGAAAVEDAAAVEGEDEKCSGGNTNEIETKYYDFIEILRDWLRDR
jgi:hypothetical protein